MFDPYHKWLGIPAREQPPNHYRLLGLAVFEEDPTVIEMAADQRLLHLRTFQASQESASAERLLNEVTSAKLCLMRADRKAQYDAHLRSGGSIAPHIAGAAFHTQSPRIESPPIIPIATSRYSETAPTQSFQQETYPAHFALDCHTSSIGRPTRAVGRKRKSGFSPFVVAGPLVGVAVVAVAIGIVNSRDDKLDVSETAVRHTSTTTRPPPVPTKTRPHTIPIPPNRPSRHIPRQNELSPQEPSTIASEPQWPAEFATVLVYPITNDIPESIQQLASFSASIPDAKWSNLTRFIPSTKSTAPIQLTFEQRIDRIDGRDIPNDEQFVTVAIGFIPPAAELRIAAWTYKSSPGPKVVLQEQPEPIVVFLSVARGKPGSATVRIKPWLGPPGATLGIPCSLPRLKSLLAGLPGMIENTQGAAQATQQQIQNLESNYQSIANSTSTNLGDKTANQAAMQTIKAHLNTQYAKLRTLTASINTMQARLNELPNLISQVEAMAGTAINYKISYFSGKQEIVVAKTNADE